MITPYPEQLAAAKAAAKHGRGVIEMPTGCGKSLVAALIVNELQVPTLIVTPSVELRRQFTESLIGIFGASKVGRLKDCKPLAVENVDALDLKVKIKGYDCVIIDEVHHTGAKTYRELNKFAWSGIYFKFGLTATFFRSNPEERLLLESVLSKVIYQIDYQVAVDKKYIVPLEAYYIELPTLELKCNGKSWHGVYSELVVNREDRNEIIAAMTANLRAAGKSTLVLVKQINHGVMLEESLGHSVNFVQGINGDNREVISRFSTGKDAALIGTTGVIGEGVDTKAAEYAILACGGKSKNAFMQMAGRVFRIFPGKESGKIILFKDASHPWLINHFKAQCKYLLEEYGIKPTKLEL